MADQKSDWKPDVEEALKALIRATVAAAGPLDPADIPSRVKERIKGQAVGDLDVEAYIRETIAEIRKNSRTRHIPILIMSALVTEQRTDASILELDVQGFIDKTEFVTSLNSSVQGILSR